MILYKKAQQGTPDDLLEPKQYSLEPMQDTASKFTLPKLGSSVTPQLTSYPAKKSKIQGRTRHDGPKAIGERLAWNKAQEVEADKIWSDRIKTAEEGEDRDRVTAEYNNMVAGRDRNNAILNKRNKAALKAYNKYMKFR